MEDIKIFFLYDELSFQYIELCCWLQISIDFIFHPNVDYFCLTV